MTKTHKAGFTLIEMLTVIVIIAIIMGIGIPAFTSLMKSGGLSGAAREVANSLGLARQYAITHRTTTRVVFPMAGTLGTLASDTNGCPWYKSYAVVDVKAKTYISKWDHLPMGTVFMDTNSNPNVAGLPPGLGELRNDSTVTFPSNSPPSAPALLAYIEFQPTGAATPLPGGGPSVFTMTEGLMNDGTTVVTPTSKTSSNTLANRFTISVDPVIGHIKVTASQ